MAVTKPQITLLQLGEPYQRGIFDDLYTRLCTKIEEQYALIKSPSLTTEHLAYSKAIIVTDGGLSKKKNKNIQVGLSQYAKNGGIVILASLFSSFVRGSDFAEMCQNMQLPWGRGDYHRTDFALNPAFAPVFGKRTFQTLEKSYSMKALHLANVQSTAKVYVPTDDSRIQSFVFPPDTVDTAQTPAVWQKHGQGHIAYIGDVNNENGSQALIMAMLNKWRTFCASICDPMLICSRHCSNRGPTLGCDRRLCGSSCSGVCLRGVRQGYSRQEVREM